jgi:hypothetical protein
MINTNIARRMDVLCNEQEAGRALCSRVGCCGTSIVMLSSLLKCDVMARCMECEADAPGKNVKTSNTGQMLRLSTSKTVRTLQMRRGGEGRREERKRDERQEILASLGQCLLSFLVAGAPSGLGGRGSDDSKHVPNLASRRYSLYMLLTPPWPTIHPAFNSHTSQLHTLRSSFCKAHPALARSCLLPCDWPSLSISVERCVEPHAIMSFTCHDLTSHEYGMENAAQCFNRCRQWTDIEESQSRRLRFREGRPPIPKASRCRRR